jgi:hypothetical protein
VGQLVTVHVAAEPMPLTSIPVENPWCPHDRNYDQPRHTYTIQLCRRCGELLYCGMWFGYPTGALVEIGLAYQAIVLSSAEPTCEDFL